MWPMSTELCCPPRASRIAKGKGPGLAPRSLGFGGLGLYRDNGKENGNCHNVIGLYGDYIRVI